MSGESAPPARVACYTAGMRTCALAILLLAAASVDRRAAAEDDAVQKLAACEGDPLRLARAVQTLGDAKLLALLADARVEVQLSAVYAAPALLEPEAALEPIAALVASRDSELAPAAARAALTIAQAVTADSLAEHEVAPAALAKARALLQQAARLTRVRADLRQLAAAAAAQLQAIGVP